MAKKKKSSRKQLNKQRRQAIERTRRRRGWRPTQPEAPPDQDLFEDLLPLVQAREDPVTRPIMMKALMAAVLDSDELAEEPEFDDIFIDPMQSMQTFIDVGEELEMDSNTLDQLPAEEHEEKQMEQLHQATVRLLTKEVRQEIDDALNTLRLRLKRGGNLKKVPQIAAIQSILRQNDYTPTLAMPIGLVYAIVQRSVAAGFELAARVMETLEEIQTDEDETTTFVERLEQSTAAKKIDKLLAQSPALNKFLQKQTKEIWEEGIEAVYNGDLTLALFTEAEKEAGLDILHDSFGVDRDIEADIASQITKDTMKIFLKNLDAYLTEQFTPERLDRLRAGLAETLEAKNYPPTYTHFLTTLQKSMAPENAVEREKVTLLKIFTGEILALATTREEEETGP